MDDFDKIIRGDGKSIKTGSFYNPRHARRVPREFGKAARYLLKQALARWKGAYVD